MAIDRIGKGGGLPPAAPATGGVQQKGAVERPFQIERAEAERGVERGEEVAAQQVDAASPLARLRAGEIDVDRYMDLKVDEATASLQGVSPAQLDEIKKVLRDQMATDPGLADLVRTATGRMPKPPED